MGLYNVIGSKDIVKRKEDMNEVKPGMWDYIGIIAFILFILLVAWGLG